MFWSYDNSSIRYDYNESNDTEIVFPSSYPRQAGSIMDTMGDTRFSGEVKSINSIFDSDVRMA